MKKKILCMLCMALAMMAWLPPQLRAQTQPAGGDGSSESPFLITSAEELQWYANYVNGESGDNVVHSTACAKLMNDIDLSTICGEGIGNWTPIAKCDIYTYNSENRYNGVFDGNGHRISNLYINDPNGEICGLFGYIYPTISKTSVLNLKMSNVQIVGKSGCAAVCGGGLSATFENIEIESGSISGETMIYGVARYNGSARNCINRANVTASRSHAAGIISNINREISNCSNYGKITSGYGRAGGIVDGSNGSTKLANCVNYGDIVLTQAVSTSSDGYYAVGGVIGHPWNLEVSNCANFGNIYLTEQSELVGIIAGTSQLKVASGIWANTGNVFVGSTAQPNVSVLQSGMKWLNDEVNNNATCLSPTTEQLASGWLTWQLQQNCTSQTWGQNISIDPKDAYPVIGGSMLYAEEHCTDDHSAASTFSNDPSIVTHNLTHHDPVAATCLEDGKIEYWSCSDCGKQWSDEQRQHIVTELTTKALGHDYNAQGVCSRCAKFICSEGHTKDQEIKAVDATCTTPGNMAYYHCSVCHKYYNAETDEQIAEDSWVIPAKGHSTEPEHVPAQAATCTKGGNHEYWYCWDCQTYFKEEALENAYTNNTDAETGVWIKKIPHTVPADFDENGLKYCSVCGYIEGEAPVLVADEASEFNEYYALSKAGHLVWMHNQLQVYDETTKTYPNGSIKCYLTGDISLSAVCHPADAANGVAEASWSPIGDITPFKGTFDGNGHTISDLYINNPGYDLGLFGRADGAQIKNVTVKGNVTGSHVEDDSQSGTYVGLIIGLGTSATQLTNCESVGSVTGYSYVGGIAGIVPSSGGEITSCTNRASVTSIGQGTYIGGIVGMGKGISSCSNFADVTTDGDNVGGLAGMISPDYNGQGISDCMNVGNVRGRSIVGGLVGTCGAAENGNNYSIGLVEATDKYAGLLVGGYDNDPSRAFENTFYVKQGTVVENGVSTQGKYYGYCSSGTISAAAKAIKQADVASGKLAYMLAKNSGDAWGQELGKGAYPVLNGMAVYFSGSTLCNGHLLSETFTNDKAQETTSSPAHSQEYEDGGFCTVCHESRELHGTGTAADPYLISNESQLEYFRNQSNSEGSFSAHAKLVNDIDLTYASAESWTPIAQSNSYGGTFDGNGHSIKNLYSSFYQGGFVGLFGFVYGGTIKNLTVEGVIESTCNYQGMIAGLSVGTNFYNCVAKGSISTTGNNVQYAGGITGNITQRNSSVPVMQGCANYVDITSNAPYTGGLIGQVYNAINMTDCANYGNVTGNGTVGGLIGYTSPQSESSITDCYVAECEVRGTGDHVFLTSYVPSGSMSLFDNIVYSKNAKVFASADATEPEDLSSRIAYGDNNASTAFVGMTAQQIGSGEATYLLNNKTASSPVWTQDLSQADGRPTLGGDAEAYTVYKTGYAHGSTTCLYSNSQANENTLHPDADDNGSHDAACDYTHNGDGTHNAACNVCQMQADHQTCTLSEGICVKCLYGELFELFDGEAYTFASGAETAKLNYTRNFGGTNWTTWYVPFELKLTPELCQKYAFSRINNVHQYDDDNDGIADRTIVESFNQTEGMTLKANYPYIVRALTDADKAMFITLDNVTLTKAESKHIECMSIDYVYTFTGTYEEMSDGGSASDSPLSLFDYADENKWLNFHSLPAQRHHLVITPREGNAPTMAPARIMLQVIGEEAVTGIVRLYNHDKRSTETYDLSGRRVNSNQRGLLIKNGKKVLIK